MEFNVTYPMERDDWVKTVLVGGVLVFFGFLFVPMLVVYGYVVRTIRGSLSGDAEPPAFGEWGGLLVDGLKAWVIGVVYLLVPALVAAVTVGGSVLAIASGSEAGAAAGLGGMVFGLALSAVLSLLFGYLAVVALVNFAREERMGAAFEFGTIRTVAFDRNYAIAWLASVGVFIVVGLISAIPLLGWIVTPFAGFYAAIVAAKLWADGFAGATGSTTGVSRSSGGEHAVR